MKRYITEFANDLLKRFRSERKAVDFHIAYLEDAETQILRILTDCEMAILTERDAMRELLDVWDYVEDRKRRTEVEERLAKRRKEKTHE